MLGRPELQTAVKQPRFDLFVLRREVPSARRQSVGRGAPGCAGSVHHHDDKAWTSYFRSIVQNDPTCARRRFYVEAVKA